MGLWQSQPVDPEKVAAERRRQKLQQHGVLIPPVFAIPCDNGPVPPGTLERLMLAPSASNLPSGLEYLHQLDWSVRLLQDHMIPGIWIAAGPHVRASILLHPSPNVAVRGRIRVEQKVADANTIQLSGGTDTLPSVRYHRKIGNRGSFVTEANTSGQTWLGLNLTQQVDIGNDDQMRRHAQIQLGSYVSTDATQYLYRSNIIKEARGYAILDFLGAKAAVETSWPSGKSRTYINVDLANDGPPLAIALERNESNESSISLSQILSFDRIHFNLLDERAPKVRNTLAWTLRFDRPASTEDSQGNTCLGAVWQFNRAVAVKALLEPSQQHISTALILKRWEEPRVVCSLLHRYNWRTSTHSFLGVGIEIESANAPNAQQFYGYPSNNSSSRVGGTVPATRAELADER